MKAPFPWFGGKSRVASVVWERFGDVAVYAEPFAGSLAVLLGRPERQWRDGRVDTVNDIDGFIANAWRAILHDPDAVASRCDWPVNENDLHARHAWLVGQRATLVPRLEGDPDYYDAKIAGWWLWGVAAWIGSGWCSGAGPWSVQDDGDGPRLVHLGNAGRGVSRRLVHLGDAGRGINGAAPTRAWLRALSERLRRVRVCSGDWSRILTSSALAPAIDAGRRAVGGPSVLRGIFLDPPYSAEAAHSIDYGHDDEDTVAHDVRAWAIEHGTDRNLRIALCGYAGEGHDLLVEDHGWSVYAWSTKGCMSKNRGKGSGGNNDRERIWFSPGCLQERQPGLPWRQE